MPNNNRAKFELSKVPPELKKVTLDHLLSYRTYKQKEFAHKKLRHQMLNDFKPKESTFRDGTQVIKHVVNEELQRTLHQNECELRLQFHQNDVDNAKKAAEVAQQEFVTAAREHFEAKEALAKEYKFGDFLQEDADVLMALDSQYDGTISALRDRMKLELQAVMTQVIDARRNIDYECENAHQKYLDFHAKKLVDRATRIQNETVRKEVEKALAQDEVVQNQQEQIKMLTEAMKLLMQDKRDGRGATKNGPQRGGGGGDKRRSKTPPPRRSRTPTGGSGKSTPKGKGTNSPRTPRASTPSSTGNKRKRLTTSGKKQSAKRHGKGKGGAQKGRKQQG